MKKAAGSRTDLTTYKVAVVFSSLMRETTRDVSGWAMSLMKSQPTHNSRQPRIRFETNVTAFDDTLAANAVQ